MVVNDDATCCVLYAVTLLLVGLSLPYVGIVFTVLLDVCMRYIVGSVVVGCGNVVTYYIYCDFIMTAVVVYVCCYCVRGCGWCL